MGWSGDFLIRYKGDSAEDFLKLAKMLIPNSIMRFDFNDYSKTVNSIELQCTRNLSWYSADEDMKRLLSYLPDEDTISMEIDGECDYEHVRICKINGKVILENSNEESERYRSNDIGIPEMLYEEHSPRYVQGEGERINVCTIDGYVQLIADTFAGDEKLIPIVQEFMHEVLDKEKINSFSWDNEDQLSEEDCTKLEQLRSQFETVDSTKQFLEEQKQSEPLFKSKKRQSAVSLPDWVQVYPKSVINALGGYNLLSQLIQTQGEEAAKEIIAMLGGGIMEEIGAEADDTFFSLGEEE